MQIQSFTPRAYQEAIIATCVDKNTLVVLPTGMGKTKIAIAAAVARLDTLGGQVLFLTPTKPLAAQIHKEFVACTDLTVEDVLLFSGDVAPAVRSSSYAGATVVVSTPQTVANDIVTGRLDLSSVVALVLDEAHRCVKDYDYTWIAKQYMQKAADARIIGLTASPGSDVASITTVCKNAFIAAVEVRTETDSDVAPYVQEMAVDWIKVALPPGFVTIQVLLQEVYTKRISELKVLGFSVNVAMSKTDLLKMMRQLQGKLARGPKSSALFSGISLVAQLLKVQHAQEQLETQGVHALVTYLDSLSSLSSKAVRSLQGDLAFCEAGNKARSLVEQGVLHPKMNQLLGLLRDEFAANSSLKVMIFNQYRDNAKRVVQLLSSLPCVRAQLFVGQAKKNGTGMSQKKQLAAIDAFSSGEINVLVSTSIGEEGLDIPQVDLLIFYEPVPSAIRSIQRRGRTARQAAGRMVVLMAKNTRDEAYHWVAHHKEKRMHKALSQIQGKLSGVGQQELSSFSSTLRIMCDTREKGSSILKHLVDLGLSVDSVQLPVADFVLADGRVGVERKSASDFVSSLLDGRLMSQVRALRESFEKPLLVIEGAEDIYSVRKVHPNAIRGALAAVALSFHVPIVFTTNALDTASFLSVVAKREGDMSKKDVGVRLERKPLSTSDMQLFVVESLPGVGPALARSLLAHFGSVYNIFLASVDELTSVEGVGAKKAAEIYALIREGYSSS